MLFVYCWHNIAHCDALGENNSEVLRLNNNNNNNNTQLKLTPSKVINIKLSRKCDEGNAVAPRPYGSTRYVDASLRNT